MFCLCFLLGVEWCLVLYSKSLRHFEFIFVHGVRVSSSFIDLHAAVQVSQEYLLKRLFPICCSGILCQRLIDHRCLGLSGLYSIPLDCMSLLVSVPYCLDDCGFVILPEVWEHYATWLVFVSQYCFGNSGSFVIPYRILDCLF